MVWKVQISFFVYLCCFFWLILGHNKYKGPAFVDFSPFRDKISSIISRPLLEREISGPVTLTSSATSCDIPASSIMFTLSTHYLIDLVVLLTKAMDVWGLRHCLEKNFITVCLDKKCLAECAKSNLLHCVLLEMEEMPPSDFGKNAYEYLTYFKHDLLFEALKVVKEVFFFDADTLLFLNPWIDTQFGRDETGKRTPARFDLQYQRDRGKGPSCGGSPNTGQMYMRNSTELQLFISWMRSQKNAIISGELGLEQDFVQNGTLVSKVPFCSLSTSKYTAHCFGSHNRRAPLKDVVSFHTACVRGHDSKRRKMQTFLEFAQQKSPNAMWIDIE